METYFNLDAADSAFVGEQLEHVMSRLYEEQFPELKARVFIPATSEAPPGATSVAYDQFSQTGKAKIVGTDPSDVPRVEVGGTRFTRPIRTIAISYAWTQKDLKAAAAAGRPLNPRKALAARRAIETELDLIAALGAPEFGIPTGFLNDANVPVTALGGGQDWATLLATISTGGPAVIKQVADALGRVRSSSKGVHSATNIVLPDANYALAATTPWSTGSDKTVLDFMESSFKDRVTFEPWNRCDTAGVGSVPRMVAYKRTEDVLGQEIPEDFTQLSPQESGFAVVINASAETAGTVIVQPTAVDFTDGV